MIRSVRKTFVNLISSEAHRAACFYCGAIAECRDHIRPWSIHRLGTVVPACSKCNGLLGSKDHQTLADRADYLMKRYERKYRRYLGVDYNKLLEEVTGSFRTMFLEEQKVAREIKRRIAHLDYWASAGRHIHLSALEPESLAAEEVNQLLNVIRRIA